MATILCADDHPLTLHGISAYLRTAGHEVVGEVDTVSSVVQLTRELKPDVLLLDLFLKDGNSLSVIEDIRAYSRWTRILIFSMSSRLVTILAGYEYGADGYLTKGIKREKIGEAIETVLSGNVYYMPGTKEELAALTNRMPVQGPLNPKVYLNLIDLKIFEFMAMGMTVDEVAENMCPSMNKKTIHNRVSQICSKLKIKRSQIQEVAIQYGLINPKL